MRHKHCTTSFSDSHKLSSSSAQTHPPTCKTVSTKLKLFKVEILLIPITYCTESISNFFIPSRQSKQSRKKPIAQCVTLSSFVTVLIDWLFFENSVCNAIFYSVCNDGKRNACDKPSIKHVRCNISFGQILLLTCSHAVL